MLSATIFKMFLLFGTQMGETSVWFSVAEALIRKIHPDKTKITNVVLRISPTAAMELAVFSVVTP
jgi:hypothetical protein